MSMDHGPVDLNLILMVSDHGYVHGLHVLKGKLREAIGQKPDNGHDIE